MHTKDKYCVGTMDGGNPTHHWTVRSQLFEFYWPQPAPWISKHRRLMWNHLVERGPVCDKEDEDYWGAKFLFHYFFQLLRNIIYNTIVNRAVGTLGPAGFNLEAAQHRLLNKIKLQV